MESGLRGLGFRGRLGVLGSEVSGGRNPASDHVRHLAVPLQEAQATSRV